jgi:hypothetical protein
MYVSVTLSKVIMILSCLKWRMLLVQDIVVRKPGSVPGIQQPAENSLLPVDIMMCDTQDKLNDQSTRQTWASHISHSANVLSHGSYQKGNSPQHLSVKDSVTADSENDSGQVFTDVLSRRSKKRKNNSRKCIERSNSKCKCKCKC